MHLKCIYLLLGLSWGLFRLSGSLHGQSTKVCINGSVGTAEEKLSYASVFLLQDGIFLNGTHTDLKGNFVIHDIAPGKYSLVVSWAGIIQMEKPEFVIPEAANYILDIELPEILMPEESEIAASNASEDSKKKTITFPSQISSLNMRDLIADCNGSSVVSVNESVFSQGRRLSGIAAPAIVDGLRLVDYGVPPAKAIQSLKILGPEIPAEYDAYYPGTIIVSTR